VTTHGFWKLSQYISSPSDGPEDIPRIYVAYIDDLLIITRGTLDDHLLKIETVLTRLCDARLKVKVAKSSFCMHEIEYLVYILTRGGIKPQPKKVQAILALNLPNNVEEL
jgi:hypothetical protein